MASKRLFTTQIATLTRLTTQPIHQTTTRQLLKPPAVLSQLQPLRFAHNIPRPRAAPLPSAPSSSTPPSPSTTPPSSAEPTKAAQPSYELTFTCVPCNTRSRHTVSKQGYHHGSVLIACPGCKNRHVISDHLKIFGDKALTVEDILREKGQLVKKGTLGEDGDLEFWEDGSTTVRDHEALAKEAEEKEKRRKEIEEKERGMVAGSTFKSAKKE
ncbi:DNL zinc finger-domain-containing protein [Triangularia verruculosa]|uniref:DNL zinc finger-domain-containing protein n=1 Tax=Triangularia verruculosa TaxID=2587418 RepID=A0AAN6XM00_9PEZI|nr:DNL zinc finger-domain-containing protein [Triangularia verruculosa]